MPLTITTELTIKPGSGQTQEQAEAEFVKLFREYLTQDVKAQIHAPSRIAGYANTRIH
jgi:hypothetical protein